MTARHAISPLWFLLPLLGVYAAAFYLVEVLPRAALTGAVAVGMTLDLVVLVPAAYYLVLVRGRGWPVVSLAPVLLLSYGAASLIVPAEHHTLLGAIGHLLPLLELSLVGYVGYRAYRVVRAHRTASPDQGDFYDRMRRTLRDAFDVPAVADALAYEVALLHYAFSIRRADLPEEGLTYHRRSGYGAVLAAVLMAAALELVAVHFLLRMWSETAALLHVFLSVYAVVWIVGDYRAMRRRPHEVLPGGMRLRCGLRWNVEVAWSQVAVVRRTRRAEPGDGYLSTVPIGGPRYVVELRAPVAATGPYGVTREVRRVGLIVDEPETFEERLRRAGVRVDS